MSDHTKDELPTGWTFDTDELSNGHYRVRGWHVDGRSVERHGGNPDALLLEAAEDARNLGHYAHRT